MASTSIFTIYYIRDEIQKNPHIINCSIKYFCKKYRVSQATIQSSFKEYYGVTFAMYVRDQCMTKAVKLLLTTNMKISEISRELGFSNSKAGFMAAFKRIYRISPGQLRSYLEEHQSSGKIDGEETDINARIVKVIALLSKVDGHIKSRR
ncbi:helix-turn-helix transcriptional regulator [Olivibacter domesticus]|uniref:AraC-type DNA-binding protein n=1 Tax=Olivibacter domesticus TaxID=407022 RepID=A0A1H7IIG0_OLID1|nr:helix-turn-helix transcriptional regulator [Olivibacter domesticus]SEK62188.1 AraC-type DNA-binding protein [Olivibacter domesticus]